MRSLLFLICVIVCISGCEPKAKTPEEEQLKIEAKKMAVKSFFPNDAENVQIVGDDWYTYELEEGDSVYTILHKINYSSHGPSHAFTVLKHEQSNVR